MAIVSLLFIVPAAVNATVIYDTGELSINAWHVHLSSHTFMAENQNRAAIQITKNSPRCCTQKWLSYSQPQDDPVEAVFQWGRRRF